MFVAAAVRVIRYGALCVRACVRACVVLVFVANARSGPVPNEIELCKVLCQSKM